MVPPATSLERALADELDRGPSAILTGRPATPRAAAELVVLEIGNDTGIGGIGLPSFGGPIIGALKAAGDDLGALTIGADPRRIDASRPRGPAPRSCLRSRHFPTLGQVSPARLGAIAGCMTAAMPKCYDS